MILISLSDLIWIFSCVPQRFVVILLRAVTSLFDQNLFHIYWIFYWKCVHWFFRIVYWMMFLICDEILIEMIFYDTWKMLLKDSWRHLIDSTKNGWLLDLSCILFEIENIFNGIWWRLLWIFQVSRWIWMESFRWNELSTIGNERFKMLQRSDLKQNGDSFE